MPLKINCPSCSTTINASKKLAGKKVKCPACHEFFRLPTLKPTNSAPSIKKTEQQRNSPIDSNKNKAKKLKKRPNPKQQKKGFSLLTFLNLLILSGIAAHFLLNKESIDKIQHLLSHFDKDTQLNEPKTHNTVIHQVIRVKSSKPKETTSDLDLEVKEPYKTIESPEPLKVETDAVAIAPPIHPIEKQIIKADIPANHTEEEELMESLLSESTAPSLESSSSNGEAIVSNEGHINLNKDFIYLFTKKYCFSCHNEDKQKGDVRLDTFDYAFSTHESIEHWQEYLDVLNAGEMPPEKKRQPSHFELSKLIGELTQKLHEAKEKLEATGGQISMRYLNRREYNGAMMDLFNAEMPTKLLPIDNTEGFDTFGQQQLFNSNYYKIYYDVGSKIAESAIAGFYGKKSIKKYWRQDPEEHNNNLAWRAIRQSGADPENISKQPNMIEYIKAKWPGKLGSKILARNVPYVLNKNHKIGASGRIISNSKSYPGQKYKMTFYTFGETKESITLLDKRAEYNQYKDSITLSFPPISEGLKKTEHYYTGQLMQEKYGFDTIMPEKAYVDYIEYEVIDSEGSFFDQTFEKVLNNKNHTDHELKMALTQFAYRAFRGIKPDGKYIDALVNMYKSYRQEDNNLQKALIAPLATIFTSPAFLYIKEYNSGKKQELKPYEFATRLSFFLKGMPADQELLAAAKKGDLNRETTLDKQLKKLIDSEENTFAMNDFYRQWIELDRFQQVSINKNLFSESVQEEMLHFFNHLIKHNLPAENLIDSDFVVINQTLADHYGIDAQLNGYEAVQLPKESRRGGVLTQAAFLMMGTAGPRTSPTIRGTIIRSKFLNDPPPPPPPNVPQLETQDNGYLTVRELVDLHKSIPQCSSCHEKLDPIGLGLENFDSRGLYVENIDFGGQKKKDGNGKSYRSKRMTKKIHSNGYIDSKTKFSDINSLKAQLLKHKDELARSLFEDLLAYALGRKIEFVDEDEITASLEELKKNHYRMKDMIMAVAKTNAFKTK